jgi:hypothetical protein
VPGAFCCRDFQMLLQLDLLAFHQNLNSMDGPLCVLAEAPRQYQALLEVAEPIASRLDVY